MLSGGRINQLKKFTANLIGKGLSFEGNESPSTLDAQKALLRSTLLSNWNGIEKSYRPTCKKIISFAFSQELFKESELAKKLIANKDFDDVTESVQSLVNANILSKIGDGTYTLHSKVEKECLAANMDELR